MAPTTVWRVRHPLLPVDLVVSLWPHCATAAWWWGDRLLWSGLPCEA